MKGTAILIECHKDYPNEPGQIATLDKRDVYGPEGKVTQYLVTCWVDQKHMELIPSLASSVSANANAQDGSYVHST